MKDQRTQQPPEGKSLLRLREKKSCVSCIKPINHSACLPLLLAHSSPSIIVLFLPGRHSRSIFVMRHFVPPDRCKCCETLLEHTCLATYCLGVIFLCPLLTVRTWVRFKRIVFQNNSPIEILLDKYHRVLVCVCVRCPAMQGKWVDAH